jgi:hypothetical protein
MFILEYLLNPNHDHVLARFLYHLRLSAQHPRCLLDHLSNPQQVWLPCADPRPGYLSCSPHPPREGFCRIVRWIGAIETKLLLQECRGKIRHVIAWRKGCSGWRSLALDRDVRLQIRTIEGQRKELELVAVEQLHSCDRAFGLKAVEE